MRYPKLKMIPETRQVLDVFRGYNGNFSPGEGQFQQMLNLTSDHFPLLSPRAPRFFYRRPASPQGLIAKDSLCYVDGTCFVMGDESFDLGLSVEPDRCPKQLVSMGAYVVILPDKVYINTKNPEDRGKIEAEFTTSGTVTVTPCGEDGTRREENAYLRIENAGMGKPFLAGDAVTLSGWAELSGSAVIHTCGDDFIVVAMDGEAAAKDVPLTVSRRMPELDFVTECGNRLWGCRYGTDESGNFVNRIYASKLGDFKNWNCFQGLSTDSYAVSCGTDGAFTGAVSYFGAPLFFKETGFHKVYGTYPATFSVSFTACRGVQAGCHRSLAIAGDLLFYVSRGAVCAFDGSLPVEISRDLGDFSCVSAAGGGYGNKYYLSAVGEAACNLFVYDAARGLWHREDDLQAADFCVLRGALYCIDAGNRNILCLTGGSNPAEETVHWLAQTGEIGFSSPDGKYLAGLQLRLRLEKGSKIILSASYDSLPEWEELATVFAAHLQSFEIPVQPRRCDHFRLKIEGWGDGKVYAITRRLQRGER